LIKSLVDNSAYINRGRKGFDTEGQEAEGRINYTRGIAGALQNFKDVGASRDCLVIAFAELTFMEQDLAYSEEDDKDVRDSLNKGIQDFVDALRCLDIVKKPPEYQIGEKLFPTYFKFRREGCPWDAYQVACEANKSRIKNILRTPGLNMKEKAVLKERFANMDIGRDAYLELQKAALSTS
jgi:hypothetical protein